MKRVEPVRDKEKIAEIEALLRKHNTSPIYGDLWVFLNQTAARVTDALALRFADFDKIEGNVLNLREKKTGKTRSIMLTARALELVAHRRADNPGHEYLFEVDSNRAKGKPISRVTVSAELAAQYDIDILPLHILLGDEEFEDGKTITPDEIYSWSDEHKTTPKTSAPSLAETIELFRPYVEEGREIVCFSISNSMSTSGNVMRLAAGELDAENRITVIDSANLSTGIGLLVIEAAIMAKNGHSASEIASVMETLKPNVRASFVVDTLTYLYRGGRCNAVAAMAGGVLKLHPKIVVENGAMDATKKYRGKINSVIMSYVKDMETDLKAARPDRVFITHSGCDAATVESVRSYLESLGVFHEILETRAGGVVSSHCGPGTLGVLFIAK